MITSYHTFLHESKRLYNLEMYSPLELNKMLHEAVTHGKSIAFIQDLINSGADLDVADKDTGRPALHTAALKGNVPVVKLLITSGAQVDSKDILGETPLHRAAAENKIGVMKALLNAGANIDPIDNDGMTPLHSAVYFDKLKAVDLLIAVGADVNIVADTGDGPLHTSVRESYVEVTKALIKAGASKDVQNEYGYTPWDVASAYIRSNIPDLKP